MLYSLVDLSKPELHATEALSLAETLFTTKICKYYADANDAGTKK
jgi:hypothetical protein